MKLLSKFCLVLLSISSLISCNPFCENCEHKKYKIEPIPKEVKKLFPFEKGSAFKLSNGDTTIKYTCDSTYFSFVEDISNSHYHGNRECYPDEICTYYSQELNRFYFTGINQHSQTEEDQLRINILNFSPPGLQADVYSNLFSKPYTIKFNQKNYEDFIIGIDSIGIDTFYSSYTLNGKPYKNVNVLSYGFQDTLWYSSDQGFLKIINGNRKFERVPD